MLKKLLGGHPNQLRTGRAITIITAAKHCQDPKFGPACGLIMKSEIWDRRHYLGSDISNMSLLSQPFS